MYTDVIYEHIGESVPKECVIADNGDGTHSLRHISELTPSTVTCCSKLNNEVIDLYSLFYMLPCLPVYNNVDFAKLETPIIVSVRWKNMIKGRYGGFFPSNIFVDVIYNNRSICTRISRRSIHMVGLKSKEEGQAIATYLIRIINECDEDFDTLNSNRDLSMEVSMFLCNFSLMGEFGVTWPVKVPSEYERIASIIRYAYGDAKCGRDIMDRTRDIFHSQGIVSEPISYGEIFTCMVNYNFELFFSIDREELTVRLRKKGWPAMFFNADVNEISITDIDDNNYEEDVLVRRKGKKLYMTTVKITRKGKVSISGSGGSRIEGVYMRVMSDIIKICTTTPNVIVNTKDD